MTDLDKLLAEIRERTERNAGLRSDDFGHDTHALLLAESEALQVAADDIERLLRIVDVQREALKHYSKLQDWAMLPEPAKDALAEAERIARGE